MAEKDRPENLKLAAHAGHQGFARLPTTQNTLAATQSDYLVYKTVVDRAVEVFGDEIKASRWLSRRQAEFNGKSPLEDLSDAHFDSQRVLEILGKIEHGVYF